MDNRQGKTNGELLAWVAGWMDGEGTYRMVPDARGGRFPQPRISAYNTDYPTLDILTTMLDQIGLPYYILHKEGQRAGWQPQWGLNITGVKRCQKWCEALLPYAVTKRHKVAAMLEWCGIRLSQPYHAGTMTDRQNELLAVFSK